MALTLGRKPDSLKVLLTPGSDFMVTLRPNNSTWPTDVRLELQIGAVTWVATTAPDGSTADWVVDQADVDAVLAANDLEARLWYVIPGATQADETRLLMAKGVAVQNA